MRMHNFLLALFFSLLFLPSKAQQKYLKFQSDDQRICLSIISLRVSEADSLINMAIKREPANLMNEVHSFYLQFVQAFISEELSDFQLLQSQKKALLSALEKVSDKNPLKRWALANVYLQSAFLRSKFNEQYAAAWEVRKAYFTILDNRTNFPDFIYNDLPFGLLQIMIGSIPPQYQWVVKLVAMEGDVDRGRNLLYELLDKAEYDAQYQCLRAEVLFFLSFAEMNLQPDKTKATALLKYFQPKDAQSLLLVYAKANLEMRSGLNDDAYETLFRRSNSSSYFPFYYLDYLQAETMLRKLDFSAYTLYNHFVEHYKGNNYKQDAMRKMAWIKLLRGDNAGYRQQLNRLGKLPAGIVEADKQAIKEAESISIPDINLLKARLLFDGGYLIRAKSLLLNIKLKINQLRESDQLALNYQMGRVEHELGNFEVALHYYLNTITMGENQPQYYAAAAALRSGEIYELKSDIERAKLYYNICLDLKPEEYRQGIHVKAKAGLNRIQNQKK